MGITPSDNKWGNMAAGFVDGLIGYPVVHKISNTIKPGSVSNCGPSYKYAGYAGFGASFLIPGGAAVKGTTMAIKGASKGASTLGKIGKTTNYKPAKFDKVSHKPQDTEETVKVYRAVSYDESMDIRKTKKFRTGKNSVEGKYFFTQEQQAWDIAKFFNSDDIFEGTIKVKDTTKLRLSGVESSGFYIEEKDLHKVIPVRSLIDDWRR